MRTHLKSVTHLLGRTTSFIRNRIIHRRLSLKYQSVKTGKLSVCLSVCPSSVRPPARPFVRPSVCVCLSVRLSVCVCLSVCLSAQICPISVHKHRAVSQLYRSARNSSSGTSHCYSRYSHVALIELAARHRTSCQTSNQLSDIVSLHGSRAPAGQDFISPASRSHSDTPHWVRLLWTSDRPVAEISTRQHTTLTTDRHPCPQHESNPQSQQANGRTSTT